MPHPASRGQIGLAALFGLCALACFAAVGAALVAQYRFHMQPCPWCILQRVIFIVVGLLSVIALAFNPLMRRLTAGLVVLLSGAGAAAALYQHYVAAKSASCELTLADRIISGLKLDTTWPDVFEVRSSCADAKVNILGVPFEFWSLALFVILLLAALRIALRKA
jgi:disulfide bond formation protein DsbB